MCGNTEVSLELLSDYVNDLYQIIPEDEQDTTFIELEFKVGPQLSSPGAVLTGHTPPSATAPGHR